MKKTKTKGQLLSLDFLLSLILGVLAIGLLIQFFEVNSYAQNQEQTIMKLSIIGETASDLIVSSNTTICEIESGNDQIQANNCLPLCIYDTLEMMCNPTNTEKRIEKTNIGLTKEFGCNIQVYPDPTQFTNPGKLQIGTECEETIPVPEPANIYSTTRKVILAGLEEKPWDKTEYLHCIRNTENCDKITIGTITLTVWKK
jgi:uncharacterized protein (UPF0333 family)